VSDGRTRLGAFLGLALFIIAGLATRLPHHAALAGAGAALSLAAGALLARLRTDERATLALAVLVSAGAGMTAAGSGSDIGWFSVCVMAGWCALVGGRRAGVIFWLASLILFGGEWLAHHDPGWVAWLAGVSFTALAAALVIHERGLVAQLRAAQAGLAERERAQERGRIARELHDVIAHSLTVSLLHVSSARLAVEHEPADAARALAEAERLGRRSLDEVRSIVGLLRSEDGTALASPTPGVEGIQELLERFRSAGADVRCDVDGDLRRLPATCGSVLYRILQESLTNAARHAPGAAVEVRLAAGPREVELAVDSAGAPGQGRGSGLLGMDERARAVGGRCTAGPGGTGWLVSAILPLT
jgi:signal transduction histidine kinase